MILKELKSLGAKPKELKKFGLVMAIAFGLLAWWRHSHNLSSAPGLGGVAVLFLLFAIFWPRLLKPLYQAWMALGMILGKIMTGVILFIIFYGIVTPMATIARLWKVAFLRLKLDPNLPSYWIKRDVKDNNSKNCERQF